MCGIAAIFAYDGAAPPVAAAELLRIHAAQKPRGPDGEGHWLSPDARVGLAQQRLAIIDLSPAGLQPFWSSDGRLAITYNGEIYNWRELRAGLEQQGAVFRTQCDTEVILALYAREGAAGLARLRGMYALALWDGEKRGLLLARDPLGIKPLYYADDGRTLRLASQVKALLAGGAIATGADLAGHAGFFLWGHVPEPFTLYRAIRSLPPGGLLWRDLDGGRWEKTASPLPDLLAATPGPALPVAERRERVRSLVAQSLQAHLVADVPVGLFLSAGRDSACLAALLGPAAAATQAFTLGVESFRGSAADEVPLAAATAQACGLAHEVRWVGQDDMLAAEDALLRAMDQPTTDGVNVYFIARAAAAAGHRVALSGLGADELFGGYPSFRQVPRLAAWPRLPGIGTALRQLARALLPGRVSPKWASVAEFAGSYPRAYLLRRALYLPWELPRLLDPDAARAGLAALGWEESLAASESGLATPRQRVTALESAQYMAGRLLRDADWAGMAHGLEIRTPFADATLYRALAPLLASGDPPVKDDLVAGDARLPAAVAARPKTGFVVPVDRWIAKESAPHERGLRGWAQRVYRAAAGDASLLR